MYNDVMTSASHFVCQPAHSKMARQHCHYLWICSSFNSPPLVFRGKAKCHINLIHKFLGLLWMGHFLDIFHSLQSIYVWGKYSLSFFCVTLVFYIKYYYYFILLSFAHLCFFLSVFLQIQTTVSMRTLFISYHGRLGLENEGKTMHMFYILWLHWPFILKATQNQPFFVSPIGPLPPPSIPNHLQIIPSHIKSNFFYLEHWNGQLGGPLKLKWKKEEKIAVFPSHPFPFLHFSIFIPPKRENSYFTPLNYNNIYMFWGCNFWTRGTGGNDGLGGKKDEKSFGGLLMI
jgi:hypothetical protein